MSLTRPHPRIQTGTAAFSFLLGLLAALPTFGIDMILPSLSVTAAALGAPASDTGLAMSVYLLSLGAALLVYGPLSDRFGRKPAVIGGCVLLIAGSLGCMLAQSLPQLLAFRALQGAGASGPGMAAVAIVRDLFEGEAARQKLSFVVLVINVVPMLAPTVGAGLLELGSWRLIYAAPLAAALVLLVAIRHLDETAARDHDSRLRPAEVVRGYLRVLTNRAILGHGLCNAAAAGAVFAYITGSSLFFINALGFSATSYGLIFSASSVSVMAGAFLNGRLGAWGVPAGRAIVLGLSLAGAVALLLLASVLLGGRSTPPDAWPVIAAMVGVALAFGLISPNAMHGAMQPMPEAAGTVSAVCAFLQMVGAATASDLTARFFDGHSALSVAAVMLTACLLSAASYAGIARPAERRLPNEDAAGSAAPLDKHGEPA